MKRYKKILCSYVKKLLLIILIYFVRAHVTIFRLPTLKSLNIYLLLIEAEKLRSARN